MTHSPGPWLWRGKSDSIHQPGGGGYSYGPRVLSLQTDGHGSDAEISVDDLNLILAAPDLLAVCERLADSAEYWGHYDVPLGIADDLRDAIKKAKGETK